MAAVTSTNKPAPLQDVAGRLSKAPSPKHLVRVVVSPVLTLPSDVFIDILLFVSIRSFTTSALVCSSWNCAVRLAVKLNRRKSEQYVRNGLICMQTTTNLREGLRLFRRAMAMNPNLAVAYYWASKALLSLGDWAGSVQVLRCALQQKPSPAESLKLRACILYAYNDDKEASQLLEQSLRMEPLDAALHFELGRCYQGLEKYSTANEYYTTALKLHYDLPCAVLDHRAECLLHSGHVEEALADLKSSFDALPDPFVARKIEAILNEFRRDLREAFQDYLPQGKSPTEVSSKCACVGPACLCLDNGVGPRHVDQEVMALQSNASVLVSEGRIQAAVDLLTQWLACNEAHEDRACQYVFRGELCGVLCDWEGAIRDYTTASEIVRHATDPAASPTLSFYLERIEELRCRQLQTASDNGAP